MAGKSLFANWSCTWKCCWGLVLGFVLQLNRQRISSIWRVHDFPDLRDSMIVRIPAYEVRHVISRQLGSTWDAKERMLCLILRCSLNLSSDRHLSTWFATQISEPVSTEDTTCNIYRLLLLDESGTFMNKSQYLSSIQQLSESWRNHLGYNNQCFAGHYPWYQTASAQYE